MWWPNVRFGHLHNTCNPLIWYVKLHPYANLCNPIDIDGLCRCFFLIRGVRKKIVTVHFLIIDAWYYWKCVHIIHLYVHKHQTVIFNFSPNMRKPCTPKKIYIVYSVGRFKSTCLGIMNELDRGNPTCIKQGRSFIIKQGLYMYLRFSGKFTPKKKIRKDQPPI